MSVPASAIRRLIGRAAKTSLSEGMKTRKVSTLKGPMKSALMRRANLSEKTERGYTQLNRLRALLEKMDNESVFKDAVAMASPKAAARVGDDAAQIASLLRVLGKTEKGADQAWRRLMEGSM